MPDSQPCPTVTHWHLIGIISNEICVCQIKCNLTRLDILDVILMGLRVWLEFSSVISKLGLWISECGLLLPPVGAEYQVFILPQQCVAMWSIPFKYDMESLHTRANQLFIWLILRCYNSIGLYPTLLGTDLNFFRLCFLTLTTFLSLSSPLFLYPIFSLFLSFFDFLLSLSPLLSSSPFFCSSWVLMHPMRPWTMWRRS